VIQASRLPIVLCCAEESEVGLVAVVDALHREGHAPEVVPGVETDANLMTAATDRVRGPALFVLCQSDDLDRFQVRRLEGLFSARKGPAHRMITVEVARRSTAAVVSEVRAAARDVSRGMGGAGRDEDDGSYMRDVVTPTSVAAVPGASVPERGSVARGRGAPRATGASSAIVQAPEGISDEALGLGGGGSDESDTEVVDPRELGRPPLREPDVQLSTDPAARAALEAAGWQSEAGPGDGVPLAVPEDFPVVGESSPDVEVRAPRRPGWDQSGPIDVERVVRRTKADPRAESDDRPLPSASSPIEVGRPAAAPPPVVEEAPRERRGARLLLLLLAGAGMGAVVTMAVLHATAPLRAGPSDVHERGVPAGDTAPPVGDSTPPTKVVPPVEPTPAPAASTGERADVGSSGPAEDAGTGGGSGDAGTGGEPEAATRGDASTGAEASGSAGTSDGADTEGGAAAVEPDGDTAGTKLVPPPPVKAFGAEGDEPKGPPGKDPGAAGGDDALAAAIAEGRVKELGALLVLNTGPSTVTWDDAAARCSRRKVAGLGNWRLPTKGQLGELRRAKLLAPGSYWSRATVGDDEAFVVDAGSGQASQWLKMEPNGRVVCVRAKPKDP